MVKKILLSAAVVGALATSAMAYNDTELNSMSATAKKTGVATPVIDNNVDLKNIGFDQTKLSDALIFPAYFVGNGWETHLRVINPTNNGVVAKVVFYAGSDSHEVRDFNIYLSPNDVWTGTVKVDSDGVAKIISTDDSAPLEDGSMASTDHPLKKAIDSTSGYVEVIAMAETNSTNGFRNGHGDHAGLRAAYNKFAKDMRTGSINTNLVFKNGVIQNNAATLPYLKIDTSKLSGYDVTGDNKNDYNITPITTTKLLTGDVRITDTVNGKDMDLPAYKVDYYINKAGSNYDSLVYLEGEKANVADVEIDQNTTANKLYYDARSLANDIANISSNQAYITYGDAPVNNMYAILTNPFKRVYVQAALDAADGATDGKIIKNQNNANGAYYKDASTDANAKINYGSTSLIAQIYDESENMMSAGQFSPATTPTIKLTNEVATTGYNVNDDNTLAYYLNQAETKGYKAGFVKLTNANGNSISIPGIMTQMLATTAGGKVVTNWIIPQQ